MDDLGYISSARANHRVDVESYDVTVSEDAEKSPAYKKAIKFIDTEIERLSSIQSLNARDSELKIKTQIVANNIAIDKLIQVRTYLAEVVTAVNER